jgi:glyoxylase-like metal-dependent hydrolase (beta-lactamase superfamily II)
VERIADGVALLRLRPTGRLQRLTNIYLLDNGDGVTVFESGSRGMADAIRGAAQRLGRIGRVVISHAHADHRGGASALDAPVLCHPEERADVEGDGGEHYFDLTKVRNPLVRAIAPGALKRMDGGPVSVSGTVSEGDEVAGFEVLHLPGHAPGLIGLWREADRLAIVSDAVFAWDPFTVSGRSGPPRLPPAPVRPDEAAARASVHRIAALDPATVCLGHYGPLTGDVRARLERVAEEA